MRLLLIAGVVGVFFVGLAASTLPGSTAEEPAPFGMHGAGRSGRQSGDGGSQEQQQAGISQSGDWRSQEQQQAGISQSGDGRSQGQQQADISRSGRDFLEVCSGVGMEGGADGEGNREARAARDATCLGWVAGFTEGFVVHDELLGTPRRDRLACVPNGESAMQIVRVMKRYLAKNPEKAHRATRYIASLALAGAFPCRGGK